MACWSESPCKAVRVAAAEARCFSRARRWTVWNSSRAALNSDESFCCVHFWDGCSHC